VLAYELGPDDGLDSEVDLFMKEREKDMIHLDMKEQVERDAIQITITHEHNNNR